MEYYNMPLLLTPFKEPDEKQKLKSTMARASGGLLITYILMYAVVFLFTFITEIATRDIYGILKSPVLLYLVSGFSSIIALPIGAAIILKFNKIRFSDAIPLNGSKENKNGLLILCALGFCMISNCIVEIIMILIGSFGIDISAGTDMAIPESTSFNSFVMILTVAVIPAFVEEILFRGAILSSLLPYGRAFAVVVSSVLFGLLHGNFVQAPFAFVVGLVLGYLTVYTGSIVPSMIVHGLNNAISVVASLIEPNVEENVFYFSYIAIVLVLIILGFTAVILLAKKSDRLMKLNDTVVSKYTLSKRLKFAFCEPVTILFLSLMLVTCFITLFAASALT